MARFLHKTTKQWHDDDGTGDLGPDYLRNPDLSAVAGVPQSRWVVDGDAVRAPNEQELAAFVAAELAAAKAVKLEAINAKTGQLIESGSVVVNGVSISTALTNQVSLQALDTLVAKGIATFPHEISATDGTSYTITSSADFVRIAGIVATFVMTTKAAGRALRAQVLAAETVEAVAAVEDNR